MNWLTKVAILVGRRKFEEFARSHPALPDDALAIANTLDTYPTRGAALLIAGSVAHAADNLLRGTESLENAATHALLIVAGLCIVWVRHAISKHDVRANDTLQKARDLAGLPRVVKAVLVLFVPFAFFVVSAQPSSAQTNLAWDETLATEVDGGRLGEPPLPTTATDATPREDTRPTTETTEIPRQARNDNVTNLVMQFVSDLGATTKFSSGVGINLHAKIAPLLSQELALFGHATSNSSWSTGPSHATYFLPARNEEQLGWSLSGSWQSPPRLLRFALFNARDIDWTVNWGLPAEDFTRAFRHVDWRENRFGASITRQF